MKTQILLIFFAACIAVLMPSGGANAKSVECSVVRPSNGHGYWSWRLIDGRKCWYAGKTMISKSLLQWPVKTSEKRSDPLDAQARLLEYANSFEARWRARAITD